MRRKQRGRQISGILVADKPSGMSSNDVVQRVKTLFGARKVGHTGSLDPLATGALPLCFGEATKFSQFLLILFIILRKSNSGGMGEMG